MKITTAELERWRQQLLFCVLVFTVVLQSPACAAAPASTESPPREALSPEEEIHLMLIERWTKSDWPGIYVLFDSTAGPFAIPDDPTGVTAYGLAAGGVDEALIEEFVRRNRERTPISPAVVERLPAGVVMDREVTDRIVETAAAQDLELDDGTRIYRESLSSAAVDAEGRSALVHTSGYCGRRCGGGSSMLLLQRGDDGTWEIERSFRGWTF